MSFFFFYRIFFIDSKRTFEVKFHHLSQRSRKCAAHLSSTFSLQWAPEAHKPHGTRQYYVRNINHPRHAQFDCKAVWHNLLQKIGIFLFASHAAHYILQVRVARVRLSISAQSYATRVDAAINRRLHYNQIKLQDLKWRKHEVNLYILSNYNKYLIMFSNRHTIK